MKDIYELLNDVEIDEDDFEEMAANEFEKEKVKIKLKESMKRKKKRLSWKNASVAAALISLSVVTFSLTFPAYAANIPVVGDIFKFFDGSTGLYDQYQENSTEVDMAKESNGIEVTLNEAIFDGKTVAITYTFETEHDLGDEHDWEKEPFVEPFLLVKGEQGWTGFSRLSKVDNNHYVGITTATTDQFEEKKEVSVELLMPAISAKNKQDEIIGDWKFNLDLKATENNVRVIGQFAERDGVKVEIDKITVTPMSFIVYYNQLVSETIKNKWPNAEVDIEIKDDLGNQYHGEVFGGWSDEAKEVRGFSKTFGKLDPKGTKLIITPRVKLYEEVTADGTYKGEKTVVLEEIEVDLKK